MMRLYASILVGLPVTAAIFAQRVLDYSTEESMWMFLPFMLGIGFILHYGEGRPLDD